MTTQPQKNDITSRGAVARPATDTHSSTNHQRAYSPAALARRWDCCRQTIYNMIDDDQLHSFKVRNLRLIPFSEIVRIERGNA